ncbi:MAG: hypothetical protein EXR48_06645 [Dehalococcoidia bacterium]|nr:hypothetical protein [Dehalococcoidia bacterium]
MVTRESLPAEKRDILRILVGEYVATAVSVSSEAGARRYADGVSPATVRNDMAEPEEMSYIVRPHVSAGGHALG